MMRGLVVVCTVVYLSAAFPLSPPGSSEDPLPLDKICGGSRGLECPVINDITPDGAEYGLRTVYRY